MASSAFIYLPPSSSCCHAFACSKIHRFRGAWNTDGSSKGKTFRRRVIRSSCLEGKLGLFGNGRRNVRVKAEQEGRDEGETGQEERERFVQESPLEGTREAAVRARTVQSSLALLDKFVSGKSQPQPQSFSLEENRTISDQLEEKLGSVASEEIIVQLGRRPPTVPAISRKRNIRRQEMLNRVSQRNDAPLFAGLLALLLVPPAGILAFAVAVGFIDVFP